MRFIKVIALALIGLLFGIGWFQLDISGYLARWEKLPSPTAEILDLFSPGIVSDEYGNPHACNLSSSEFSFLSNTPKNIAGCVEHIDRAADATARIVYILDESGEVWRWTYVNYAYYYFAKSICFPAIGFIFGLMIALFINGRASNRQRVHGALLS